MIDLTNISTDAVSVIKDPFNKECVDNIIICIRTNSYTNKKYCYAKVEFINGNTKGEQKFGDYADFKVLMTELQAFMDSLENNNNNR